MKFALNITASIVAMIMLLLPIYERAQEPKAGYEAVYETIGLPLSEYYPTGIPARTVWGMKYYSGKLFISSGDYDVNAGPVQMYHYDLSKGQWIDNGTVPDEQLQRFYIIGNTLISPGIDPREDWNLGNLYYYEDDQWRTMRTIPNGIHQFDIAKYDDRLFVAIGTGAGNAPIVVSDNHGETFQPVNLVKNGEIVDTSKLPGKPDAVPQQIRAYDFFHLNGSLYAFYFGYFDLGRMIEIYRYDGENFVYHSSMPEDLSYNRINYMIFPAKAEFNGLQYFSTGHLYYTDDMTNAHPVTFRNNDMVSDLKIIGTRLYASVITKLDNGMYRNSLWVRDDYKHDLFHELFYFHFPCPVQCFEYHDGVFYFGMGEGILSEENELNGTVLSISHSVQ